MLYNINEEQLKTLYPNLSKFGLNMLHCCDLNGLLNDEKGKQLLNKVEDYFNNIESDDEELNKAIKQWYDGVFCQGFFMNDNDSEFAKYLKSKISMKIF